MKDDNDKMLQQFFSSAAEKQIADDGFSEAVMNHITAIDRRMIWLSRIWTLICCIGGVVFLAYSDVLSKLFNVGTAGAYRGMNEVAAYLLSFFKFLSTVNIGQIPQFVYLMPLVVTVAVAGVMIKENNKQTLF